jgi:predicted lipoprotein with Yx(FWY)xxD motif
MVPSRRGQTSARPGRWGAVVAATTVAGLLGGTFFASAASAQGPTKTPKPTVVVKEVTRGTFGEILTTTKKKALYIDTGPACTASCLTIWPPLLMPKNKTMPGGIAGLGTMPFGTGQLQVTYNGAPLYLFYTDTKKSVSGQGLAGFFVVQPGT